MRTPNVTLPGNDVNPNVFVLSLWLIVIDFVIAHVRGDYKAVLDCENKLAKSGLSVKGRSLLATFVKSVTPKAKNGVIEYTYSGFPFWALFWSVGQELLTDDTLSKNERLAILREMLHSPANDVSNSAKLYGNMIFGESVVNKLLTDNPLHFYTGKLSSKTGRSSVKRATGKGKTADVRQGTLAWYKMQLAKYGVNVKSGVKLPEVKELYNVTVANQGIKTE